MSNISSNNEHRVVDLNDSNSVDTFLESIICNYPQKISKSTLDTKILRRIIESQTDNSNERKFIFSKEDCKKILKLCDKFDSNENTYYKIMLFLGIGNVIKKKIKRLFSNTPERN